MGLRRNMHLQKTSRRRIDPTAGVSEIIGAILMISLVVMTVTIVGILLLSQTMPQKIPNINFMTGSDNNNRLYLYHNGGDSLVRGDFSVMVDGGIRNDYSLSDGGNEWSLGKNLILTNVPSGSHRIAIIYNGTGSGAVVLRSASSSIISATVTDNPDIRPLTAYPPVISVQQLMQNVSSRSIIFYREKNAGITQSPNTYLIFNITLPNSTISTTPTCSGSNPFSLNVGDQVTITQTSDITQGFRIAGIGDQLWELTADNVALIVQDKNGVSHCSQPAAIINHTLITGYNNLKTNLTVTTAIPVLNSFTALTVYNYMANTTPQSTSQIINGFTTDAIVITNISPNSVGYFVFQLDNTTKSVYFAGNSTRITRNSVQIYP